MICNCSRIFSTSRYS